MDLVEGVLEAWGAMPPGIFRHAWMVTGWVTEEESAGWETARARAQIDAATDPLSGPTFLDLTASSAGRSYRYIWQIQAADGNSWAVLPEEPFFHVFPCVLPEMPTHYFVLSLYCLLNPCFHLFGQELWASVEKRVAAESRCSTGFINHIAWNLMTSRELVKKSFEELCIRQNDGSLTVRATKTGKVRKHIVVIQLDPANLKIRIGTQSDWRLVRMAKLGIGESPGEVMQLAPEALADHLAMYQAWIRSASICVICQSAGFRRGGSRWRA